MRSLILGMFILVSLRDIDIDAFNSWIEERRHEVEDK